MYLAIIVLPLLGSIVSGLLGRKIGVSGAQIVTCSCVIITTILAILTFIEVGLNHIAVVIELFRWIDSESLNVLWSFNFDSLTVCMLIPVLIVSSLVHIYSIAYMNQDPHNQRFFSYLSLFTSMMIILITANNFLLMFLGWEGVGICSYLLVNFWYTRIAANQSSYSAFITNRVGDCFLTIGMFAILWSFGNVDYYTVFSLAPYMNENIITIIGICLLIGAMAKSSQVGLHVWLPMAMEGPTPVSALIHAATMVTAGVYLLMRTSPLIEYSSTVLILCLWIGAITTVFSSLIALFQGDIKKIIAYSTMSQLGMMVIAIGLSSYNIALFHLVNHAFYKALLFLGAGSVIHAVADNQDLRKYGGLISFLPLTYSVILIASLSLVAFPFMTGFYSKDFILESVFGQFYLSSTIVYLLATVGAILTTLYSVKILYLTFLTKPNGPSAYYYNWNLQNYKLELYTYLSKKTVAAQEGNIFMTLPLIILAIFSIFFGYITKDIFIGFGSGFFADNSLFVHPSHEILIDTEFAVSSIFKLLPLIFTLSLTVISIVLLEFIPKLLVYFKLSLFGYNIFSFFNQRFLIELFYNKYLINFLLKLGGHTSKVIDKGSVELLGPYGLEKKLLTLSKNIASLDTGIITSYALYILLGFIFYILLPYLSTSDNSFLLLLLLALFSILANYISNKQSYNFYIFKNIYKTSGFNLLKYLFILIRYFNLYLVKHIKFSSSYIKYKHNYIRFNTVIISFLYLGFNVLLATSFCLIVFDVINEIDIFIKNPLIWLFNHFWDILYASMIGLINYKFTISLKYLYLSIKSHGLEYNCKLLFLTHCFFKKHYIHYISFLFFNLYLLLFVNTLFIYPLLILTLFAFIYTSIMSYIYITYISNQFKKKHPFLTIIIYLSLIFILLLSIISLIYLYSIIIHNIKSYTLKVLGGNMGGSGNTPSNPNPWGTEGTGSGIPPHQSDPASSSVLVTSDETTRKRRRDSNENETPIQFPNLDPSKPIHIRRRERREAFLRENKKELDNTYSTLAITDFQRFKEEQEDYKQKCFEYCENKKKREILKQLMPIARKFDSNQELTLEEKNKLFNADRGPDYPYAGYVKCFIDERIRLKNRMDDFEKTWYD